jgi:putative redox protein
MTLQENQVELTSDGNRLDCWSLIPDDPRGSVILLHGVSTPVPDPNEATYGVLARAFAERGWASLWVDMRGVRGSEGFFSLSGWLRDGGAAAEIARSLAPGPFVVVGNSAGGCVATYVAVDDRPDALVLIATPAAWIAFGDSDTALQRIQALTGMRISPEVVADPSEWAAEFGDITTARAIGKVASPTLIVHGTADATVPVQHAHTLSDAAPGADVELIEGADHRLRHNPVVVALILDWLDKKLPR